LEAATENQVVRLDIKAGAAWWVTRLLALTAGAVRVRCPRAIVFVGEKENVQGAFLGWSTPPLLLKAILADTEPRGGKNVTYAAVYRTASVIAKQFATFGGLGELPDLPFPPPPAKFPLPPGQPYPPLPSQTQRYLDDARYAKLGEAALEQILMDQLALYQLEDPPDRVTLGRLEELFAHCLYRETVDLDWPKEQQVTAFLSARADYVALVRA